MAHQSAQDKAILYGLSRVRKALQAALQWFSGDPTATATGARGSALNIWFRTNLTATQTGDTLVVDATGSSSPLTTKGDLYTHDATTDVRLPIGADGEVVIADSTQPTGIRWGTAPAGESTSLYPYKAKTTATSGYPGDGYMLWNNATQTSATTLILSHLTNDNFDVDLFLSQIAVNSTLLIQDQNDSTNYQKWTVSGTPTNTNGGTSTSYWTFPVTLVTSAGTGTTGFANNHSLFVARFSSAGSTYTDTGITFVGGAKAGTAIDPTLISAECSSMCVGDYAYPDGGTTWQLWVYPTPASGTFELDVRKKSFANSVPGSGDSICASAKPTLTGDGLTLTETGNLSTWTGSPLTKGQQITVVPTINTANVTWWALYIPVRRTF